MDELFAQPRKFESGIGAPLKDKDSHKRRTPEERQFDADVGKNGEMILQCINVPRHPNKYDDFHGPIMLDGVFMPESIEVKTVKRAVLDAVQAAIWMYLDKCKSMGSKPALHFFCPYFCAETMVVYPYLIVKVGKFRSIEIVHEYPALWMKV